MGEMLSYGTSIAKHAALALIRGTLLILFGGPFVLYATEQAQAGTAQGLDNPTLSFNLTSNSDYNPGMPFIDLMKMMRPWFARDSDANRMSTDDLRDGNYLDADGWVTHIPEGTDGVGTQWEWSKLPLEVGSPGTELEFAL